jgi:hypothetical protein
MISAGRVSPAKMLEERAARHRKLLEAQAVADDQLRRAQIWQDMSADQMPPGVTLLLAILSRSG